MKKGHSWLRFVILGTLIALMLTLLMLFYRLLRGWSEHVPPDSYAVIVLTLVFVCCILIAATQLFFGRKETSQARSERDEAISGLRAKAQTDALTGLLNREAAVGQITQFLSTEGCNHCHTLMMIDLDNFKGINDNFGHFEGDKALRISASKIKAVFRSIDIVGRLGGDEFIVLMKHTSAKSVVRRKAWELLAALEYITSDGDISVTVTGSVGITAYNGDGKTFETLYKEADEALYRAKLDGKNRYFCFAEAVSEEQPGEADESSGTVLRENGAFIQLQALIDNIDGGIALLEIADEIRAIYLSNSYIRLMQLSYSDVKAADNRVFDFIHKDDIAQVENTLRLGAESGKPVEAVFRKLTDSGETKWHHIRAVRIQYEDSDKPVLIAIVTDVTNLKMAEHNFRAQKMQLETVLRISRVITFEVDIASRTMYVTNPTITKYGIDFSTIEDMPESLIAAGVIHPDSVDEYRRMYDEIYSGIPEGSAIIRTLKRDGQYTLERLTYFTVYDERGYPVKAVGVDEDMETRTAALLRVDLIERQFRKYSENVRSIIKVVVAEDSFEFLKPEDIPEEARVRIGTYSELLDYRTAQIIDPADRELVSKKFCIDSLRTDHSDRGEIVHEYQVCDNDRTIRWNLMIASMHIDQIDGDMYVFIRTRDITFRKILEQALEQSGEKVIKDPVTGMYTFETFSKLSDLVIGREGRRDRCAVLLFTIRNHDDLLEQYGRIMMKHMLVGFTGKIMLVYDSDHLTCYDGKHTMALFVPVAGSDEAMITLGEEILKFLRNPAYFQFLEEVFLDFSCGISVSEEKTSCFAELYDKATRALRSLDDETDKHIALT